MVEDGITTGSIHILDNEASTQLTATGERVIHGKSTMLSAAYPG